MTQPGPDPNKDMSSHHEALIDQREDERTLIDTYKERFPNSDQLETLASALQVTRNFYLGDYIPGPSEYVKLPLRKSPREGSEADETIFGEVPLATKVMIEDIHRLLHAQVKRDDHSQGKTRGVVVREGKYGEEPVYTVEHFVDGQRLCGDPSKSSLELWLVDEIRAKSLLQESNNPPDQPADTGTA